MSTLERENDNILLLSEISVNNNGYEFSSIIDSEIDNAERDLLDISEKLEESIDTLKKLSPNCDKIDYMLAASSGALCSVIDIFLVGSPSDSVLLNNTDKWFENHTKDFAKLCGWKDKDNPTVKSAIRFLEKKFKVPYDQNGIGESGAMVFDLTPKNHHFKSLAHNPSIVGLFFSILNQFTNTSHFVTEGKLIVLQVADKGFELKGNNLLSKIFCGFVNWLGHLISDMSGSSSSKSRGMGIASPLWTWINDIIAIKGILKIPVNDFDKNLNNLAIEIYEKGYDLRFQSTQMIPVLINELIVRLFYSTRRFMQYLVATKKEEFSFANLWKCCEPFSNASVKRMLTIAHGTFCIIDIGDATLRAFVAGAGTFNVAEFCMRLNITGLGRFTFSLYGEAKDSIKRKLVEEDIEILENKKVMAKDYLNGLKIIANTYDDKDLLIFTRDLEEYMQKFEESILIAEKRNVPSDCILRNKADIDRYFGGRCIDEN